MFRKDTKTEARASKAGFRMLWPPRQAAIPKENLGRNGASAAAEAAAGPVGAQAEQQPAARRRWKPLTVLFIGSTLLLTAAAMGSQPADLGWDDSPSRYGSPETPLPPLEITPPARERGEFPGNPDREEAPDFRRRDRSHEPDRLGPRSAPPRLRHHPGNSHEEELPEPELSRRKLTVRYGNPAVARLVRSMSPEQSRQLYLEVSGLIDARHLKPSSYDERVKKAAKDLCLAVENRAFLQANGLGDDAGRLAKFRQDLSQLVESGPIRGGEEAYQALQWTMQLAERDAGLRPATVALEFIFGATDSLDKYSAFVPTIDRNAPSVELEDHIVGIGVEIKSEEQGMLVVNALPGSPAAEAGLQTGDLIQSINGRDLAGTTVEYAVDLIAGPPGSHLTLTVDRDHHRSDMTLTRRRVEMHSVSAAKLLDQNVGYIKLEKFAQNSSDEFDQALWGLYRDGMKSLVVDVRGNPGGLLTTAIQLSNKFVPAGTIVSTRGRDASDNTVEQADGRRTWKIPMVVLVDGNSASASEIFAAAIQENGRGLIVGRTTYGKGTVQTHFPLQTVSANLRLTTAQFFSPKGRTMAGEGVEPDVRVEAEQSERHHHHHPSEASHGREEIFEHDGARDPEGHRHHEAAYRHGGASGDPEMPRGSDRDLAAAIETATSQAALDMARQAGERRHRQVPALSN